ncbi:Mitochondrial 37S ribosomal protein S27 [Sphaceloma murrayae]|uniref:Small ribosomal subunit protein mS33 n=1 Tax=Sphaceloma murrayae TaxID=2082308 RepID=A0A2K1QL21_9PEZI|nr:Mitochondrial 37S ribosomal protein S27 [Sphaceloma murrayae]
MSLPQRLTSFFQTQCRIFNTTYNPLGHRRGNKILRQRLKGPSLAAYYPRRIATIKDLAKAYPDYEVIDEDEDDRLENVQITKSRGKGPPKKKRSKEVAQGKKKKR